MAILRNNSQIAGITLSASGNAAGVVLQHKTDTEMNNISSPTAGDVIFNTTDNQYYTYSGNAWTSAKGSAGGAGAGGSAGADGDRGTKGSKGTAGAQGAKGTTGDANNTTGATGDTGATGAKGATGAQGYHGAGDATGGTGAYGARSGPKGDTGGGGDTGYQGNTNNAKGATGPQGPQGPKGPAGYTGYMGYQGATGGGGAYGARSGPKGAKGDTGYTGYHGNTNTQTGAQGNKGGGGPPGVSNTGNLYWAFGPGSNWPGPQFQRIFLGGTWNSNHGVDARGGNTSAMQVDNYYPASYGWRQYVNSNPYSWTFRGDGNPGNSLQYLKSNGQYYHKGNTSSDQRIKKDITTYTASVLDTKIKDEINASSYIFIGNEVSKSEWTASADDDAKIGFIAQHLTASAPELVDMRDLSGLSVDDGGITALLTKAFQEVSSSLSDLGSRIAVLES